ncbi:MULTISPECIES: single-stranded-DNA-specific exonuclease RecJ [Prochlorococcus]|uniref:single-stranded-DNA-specific exonuclease RecJ n=1 Tax=Prochlorococcus TaxID=1218 RepID=UPI000533709F|nr:MULTISPECIES: single-stranded-DNA-specific exonuclease RecJ [Prochlorococcus]KGG12439.1 Single-stranded-DNA-specific exonuclease RecJ [Prochlorococcus sp. MIT 0601]
MKRQEFNWQTPTEIESTFTIPYEFPRQIQEVLIRRGISDLEDFKQYIEPAKLPNPNKHFKDLEKATKRIINARQNKEKIAICGDYDADGMTSTALLVDYFRKIDINVTPIIPSRKDDGYGINESIINRINQSNIKLVITVDNGVSASGALLLAKENEIDVIVTDHHIIKEDLPSIFSLIHPSKTPDESPYKFLAGVGLAYLLAESIAQKTSTEYQLGFARDLFCIGTIADMATLKGANRYWLKKWMKHLKNTDSYGLQGLIGKSKLKNKIITSEDIAFQLAPRINSVGRISEPSLILELFLESKKEKADKLATEVEKINKERKLLCKTTANEAIDILEKDNLKLNSFILLAQSHWHQGVIGIVAARIMERYNRPTAILTSDSNGTLRASVRAPKGFNVFEALDKCKLYLEKYGGHAAAGGFTVKAENISNLEKDLNSHAESWLISNTKRVIKPDSYIKLCEITKDFCIKIQELEPFGQGNSKPIFWTRGCNVLRNQYLYGGCQKIEIEQGKTIFEAINWNNSLAVNLPKKIDIAFYIDYDKLIEEDKLQITLCGIKEYKNIESFNINNRRYKCSKTNEGGLLIENEKGEELTFTNRCNYNEIDNSYIKSLVYTSISILGL